MKGRLIMSYLSVAIVGVTFELRVLFRELFLYWNYMAGFFSASVSSSFSQLTGSIGVKRLKLHWHMPCIFSMHGINF